MKRKINIVIPVFILGLLCCASTESYSCDNNGQITFITCDSTQWAQPGTYEIITISGSTEASPLNRPQEILTSDQLCTIESSRHQTQIIELQLSPYTKVKIYPGIGNQNTGPK